MIVSKIARESNYWFKVLDAVFSETYKNEKLKYLFQVSFELKKIFIPVKMTAEQNYYRKKNLSSINHQPLSVKI